jgi:hypothetical protein
MQKKSATVIRKKEARNLCHQPFWVIAAKNFRERRPYLDRRRKDN